MRENLVHCDNRMLQCCPFKPIPLHSHCYKAVAKYISADNQPRFDFLLLQMIESCASRLSTIHYMGYDLVELSNNDILPVPSLDGNMTMGAVSFTVQK